MMNSIAPFWDGNETWLVLGGGGLFAAFPLAYAVLMPALYIPVIFMLLGLIFRGVAFEFRFKADEVPPHLGLCLPLRISVGHLHAGSDSRGDRAGGEGGGAKLCRRRLRLAQCLQLS